MKPATTIVAVRLFIFLFFAAETLCLHPKNTACLKHSPHSRNLHSKLSG